MAVHRLLTLHSPKPLVLLLHASVRSRSQFRALNQYIPLSTCEHTEQFYDECKLLAERKPFPFPASSCLQRAAAIQTSSPGISEEWQLGPTNPSLIACPI